MICKRTSVLKNTYTIKTELNTITILKKVEKQFVVNINNYLLVFYPAV